MDRSFQAVGVVFAWCLGLLVLLGATDVWGQGAAGEKRTLWRKAPPEGVVEISSLTTGIPWIQTSLVELKDGSLLASSYQISRGWVSTDGGKTWSNRRPFGEGVAGNSIQRLRSGKLALSDGGRLWLSGDEGKTWGEARRIHKLGSPLNDTLIQLSSGRLLQPSRTYFGNQAHVGLAYLDAGAYGTWRGQRYHAEGHGHTPEADIAGVSYSDDEGGTWKAGKKGNRGDSGYHSAVLMGWFGTDGKPTTGDGGVTPADEPCVAETKDGRVLFFARSTVGRIVQSYSSDGGLTWTPVEPTVLPSSYSSARLRRIPKTGDLMCVWNQVSPEEIRRGYRRGRLSAAISTDSGRTWGHFKTLELSGGLEDVDRVEPGPIEMVVRARKDVGELPDDFAYFHYANVRFVGDKVYIMYGRSTPLAGIAERELYKDEQVLRIYPLEWFYR